MYGIFTYTWGGLRGQCRSTNKIHTWSVWVVSLATLFCLVDVFRPGVHGCHTEGSDGIRHFAMRGQGLSRRDRHRKMVKMGVLD